MASPVTYRLLFEVASGRWPHDGVHAKTRRAVACGDTDVELILIVDDPATRRAGGPLLVPAATLPLPNNGRGWEGFLLELYGRTVDPADEPARGPSLSFLDKRGK